MMLSANFETARPLRKAVTIWTGDVFGRTEIMAGSDAGGGPHAFLVEQPPNAVLPPHFHMTDQFQVFVAGSAMLGRSHRLAPLTVHYARGKTAYGPLTSGSEGLFYLTLRPRVEYGAHYLADPNTQVDRKAPKFHTTSLQARPLGKDELAGSSGSQDVLIEQNADGLAAWLSCLAKGTRLSVPEPDSGAGRFHVVTGGSAMLQGESLPPWSCIWMTAEESSGDIEAGPHGAQLVTLQFPRNTPDAPAPATAP